MLVYLIPGILQENFAPNQAISIPILYETNEMKKVNEFENNKKNNNHSGKGQQYSIKFDYMYMITISIGTPICKLDMYRDFQK